MPTPHYFLYPFGQNADDLTAIPDAPAIDGSVSYYYGWTDPYEYNLLTNPAALPIPRGQMNQLFYDVTLNIQEYQQYGVPAWYSTISYPIYARVYYSNLVYENQVASNTATPGTDISWLVVSGNKVYYAQVTFQPTTQQVVASPGMSIIQFNSVITDSNNWWNAGTYLFTPTIPGKYRFSSVVHAEPASSSNQYVSLQKNGSEVIRLGQNTAGAINGITLNGTAIETANGTDTFNLLFTNPGSGSSATLGYDGTVSASVTNLFEIQYLGK